MTTFRQHTVSQHQSVTFCFSVHTIRTANSDNIPSTHSLTTPICHFLFLCSHYTLTVTTFSQHTVSQHQSVIFYFSTFTLRALQTVTTFSQRTVSQYQFVTFVSLFTLHAAVFIVHTKYNLYPLYTLHTSIYSRHCGQYLFTLHTVYNIHVLYSSTATHGFTEQN